MKAQSCRAIHLYLATALGCSAWSPLVLAPAEAKPAVLPAEKEHVWYLCIEIQNDEFGFCERLILRRMVKPIVLKIAAAQVPKTSFEAN